jgi:hypothetical protein
MGAGLKTNEIEMVLIFGKPLQNKFSSSLVLASFNRSGAE